MIGFLSHLHSLVVTMSQKSSLIQTPKSVSQVLTADSENETTVSLSMAYPSLVEFGDFDNRQDTPPSHHTITKIRA